jgi:hypothetical protein
MSEPEASTALAEPMFVWGAIAATSAASVMKAPAEAPRAPSGEIQTTTGIGASMMSLMISRIEESSPPGVSRRMIARGASSSAASSSAEAIHFSVAGSTVPVNSIEGMVADSPCAPAPATAHSMPASTSPREICARTRTALSREP